MLYKHYKGALYRVIAEGYHSETLEEVTIYISVNDGRVWVRPTKMFHELVEVDKGIIVPRFEKMDETLKKN